MTYTFGALLFSIIFTFKKYFLRKWESLLKYNRLFPRKSNLFGFPHSLNSLAENVRLSSGLLSLEIRGRKAKAKGQTIWLSVLGVRLVKTWMLERVGVDPFLSDRWQRIYGLLAPSSSAGPFIFVGVKLGEVESKAGLLLTSAMTLPTTCLLLIFLKWITWRLTKKPTFFWHFKLRLIGCIMLIGYYYRRNFNSSFLLPPFKHIIQSFTLPELVLSHLSSLLCHCLVYFSIRLTLYYSLCPISRLPLHPPLFSFSQIYPSSLLHFVSFFLFSSHFVSLIQHERVVRLILNI